MKVTLKKQNSYLKINPKFQKLLIRAATGISLVLLIVLTALWHPLAFFLLTVLIALGSMQEFYSILAPPMLAPQKRPALLVAVLAFLIAYLKSIGFSAEIGFILLIPAGIAVFIVEMYRKTAFPYQNIAYTLFGLAYIAGPLITLFFIGFPQEGLVYRPGLIVGFFVLMWTHDTGAYLTGITMGKTALFKRLSPKKTVEGLLGGIAIALIAGVFIAKFSVMLTTFQWLGAAVLIAVFSTLGDLAESMLKRSATIKDSGKLLPGHGGILDRFDGVFFAAPMFYLYLQIVL